MSILAPRALFFSNPAEIGCAHHGCVRAMTARQSSSSSVSLGRPLTDCRAEIALKDCEDADNWSAGLHLPICRRGILTMAMSMLLLPSHLSTPVPAFAAGPGWEEEDDGEIERQLREAIRKVVDLAKAPGVLRLAFHDAGTFDALSSTGGMNGSIIFELERPESIGLKRSIKVLKKVRAEMGPTLSQKVSWADLIAVGGSEAVEMCGGPKIDVGIGRLDLGREDEPGRMPAETLNAEEVRRSFLSKGFSTQEAVALLGAHTLGGKGFGNPTVFDNSYFSILLERPWENQSSKMSEMVGLPSDRAISTDDESLRWISLYAKDQSRFFEDFSKAYVKLVNSGARWIRK